MDNVLVVEDQPRILEWIVTLASQVFPEARFMKAATLEQAKSMIDPLPDLLLTDLSLPDGLGHELIAVLKKRRRDLPCIVVTSFEDDDFLFPALKSGADGYLLKDQTDSELTRLLTGILNGSPPMSPAIAYRLFEYFRTPQTPPDAEQLTAREKEILQLISKGYSGKECAKLLDISHYTVAGYIKEVYRKLHINSRAEAALAAARLGLS